MGSENRQTTIVELEAAPAGYQDACPIPSEALKDYWAVLEPRIHRQANVEVEAAEEVEKKWLEYGGAAVDFTTKGIADIGGMTACCLPEGDIEKYRKIYELIALLYLEDDFYDGVMSIESKLDSKERKNISSALKQLRGMHYAEMVQGAAQDKVLLKWVRKWDEWSEQSKSVDEQGFLEADSLETHLNMRNTMHGCHQFNFMMVYACDINLSDTQVDSFRPAKELIFQISSLGNDILSFDREWISHVSDGNSGLPPASSISFILLTQGVTVLQAKQIAKEKYLEIEQKFIELRRKLLKEQGYTADTYKGEPVPDAVRYLSYLQYIASGNLMWSLRAKRFRMDPQIQFYPKPEHKLQDLLDMIKPKQTETIVPPTTNGNASTASTKSAKRRIDSILDSDSTTDHTKRHKAENTVDISNSVKPAPWLAAHPPLPDATTLAPYNYVASLSGKRVRKALVDAIDVWYKVPEDRMDLINSVVNLLHSSSLIIDDIEDGSVLRRGEPAAHMVFGTAQSINSANYLLIQSINEARDLSAAGLSILMDELRNLHIGQGWDLATIFHTECPSMVEYIQIVDGKTGGLFRIIGGLMRTEATQNGKVDIQELLTLLGRYYQIWDDYNDLISKDGSASDLDEGIYSFIMVHALTNSNPSDGLQIKSLLDLRSRQGSLTREQKALMMKVLARTKSLDYTVSVLGELQDAIENKLVEIESCLPENQKARKNWIFRAIMAKIRVFGR
ncbi:hypothetical protein TWF694_008897 [Orbilia ellipsospora]|uniref:Uncharacterized protein n=1 Tax=Orbilia ellipsospora TaxID=2528407 RepID=A0AAV9XGK0_9PEZI